MRNLLLGIQIAISALLVAAILLQQRGGGLGSAWGGAEISQVYRSKRGLEKFLFGATIGLAVLFIILALVNLILV